VEALWGVGPVTAGKLRNVGIERLVQIRSADLQLLRNTVGSLADWLRQLSYGDDPRPVVPDRESKSSSTENTYAEDLVDADAIRAELDRMARENAEWLARRRLAARTVTIKVRYADFKTVTRSHTLSRHTADADLIASWAMELAARTEVGTKPVRLLGVRVHALIEQAPG
jgi:DNA polymerase IV